MDRKGIMGKLENANILNVNIFVTNECNMNCLYCYESTKLERRMSAEVEDGIVNYVCKSIYENNFDILKIQFHGGEPLLAVDVIKNILLNINENKPSRCKIITSLTTNGTVMTEEIISFLSKEINLISISIDGKRESHNINRKMLSNGDSYDLVKKNAILLLGRYPNLVARMTIAKNTLHNVAANIIYLIKKGFKIISPTLDFTDDSWTEEDIYIYCKELELVYNFIQRENIDATITPFESIERTKKGSKCLGGTGSISIDVDGKIYPCMLVVGKEEWAIGDVFLGVDKHFSIRLKNITDIDNIKCKGCGRIEYCEGNRCKIINKFYTGDYYNPLPLFCVNEHVGFHCCQIKNKKERRTENDKN